MIGQCGGKVKAGAVREQPKSSQCPDLFRASSLSQAKKMAGTKPGHDELGREWPAIWLTR